MSSRRSMKTNQIDVFSEPRGALAKVSKWPRKPWENFHEIFVINLGIFEISRVLFLPRTKN